MTMLFVLDTSQTCVKYRYKKKIHNFVQNLIHSCKIIYYDLWVISYLNRVSHKNM